MKVATGILVLGLFVVGSGVAVWGSIGLRGVLRSRGVICWGSIGTGHGFSFSFIVVFRVVSFYIRLRHVNHMNRWLAIGSVN